MGADANVQEMAQAERTPVLPSPEDFLAAEEASAQKHEYVGGAVFGMAGGSPQHSRICARVLRALGNRLAGRKCEVFTSDMLVRVRLASHTRFYYPDAHVVCEPEPEDQRYHDGPV